MAAAFRLGSMCRGYLAEEKDNVYLVGDCKQIGNLRSVIWRAYEVAMEI